MEQASEFVPQDGQSGEDDGGDDVPRGPLTVEQRLAVIETEWRQMQVEWLSMYDQFRSLYGRIARRQQREEQVEPKSAEKPYNPAALAILNGGRQ